MFPSHSLLLPLLLLPLLLLPLLLLLLLLLTIAATHYCCYSLLLQCCRPERGLEIMQEMAKLNLRPDTVTINTLIDAHCSAGQMQQAWLLLAHGTPLLLTWLLLAPLPHLPLPSPED